MKILANNICAHNNMVAHYFVIMDIACYVVTHCDVIMVLDQKPTDH